MSFQSTQKLYQKIAKGEVGGFTIPAFNLRTLTFDLARALFRQAKKQKVGAFIIELAQSEMAYTNQSPAEYAQNCLKAAKAENWPGPIFLQGDHFKCLEVRLLNIRKLEGLIKEALKAGFYNLDIDCSKLPLEQNIKQTSHFINFIRQNQPKGITIALGGEVGEIGGKNTTLAELDDFLKNLWKELSSFQDNSFQGISKAAVQTGTSHGKGGEIDWELLEDLNKKAKDYGLAGVVQHGASTLPREQFKKFPVIGVCEIHLATEIMQTVLESPELPAELKEQINNWPDGPKKALGPLKEKILALPQKNKDKIAERVGKQFEFFFQSLNVENTLDLIQGIYQP